MDIRPFMSADDCVGVMAKLKYAAIETGYGDEALFDSIARNGRASKNWFFLRFGFRIS